MILKSRIRFISPHKWFPSDNPVATVVARLCVLREDLYIELLGVAAEDIFLTIPTMQSPLPNMDDNGDAYRRMYFMRASLRTLFEVRGAILVLVKNKEFVQHYEKWDKPRFQELKDFLAELEKNLSEFKRIRDAIGGHVLPQAITKALDTMDYDEIGKYELGRTMKETHFGFAGTICAQILLQDIPKKEKEEHLQRIFTLNMRTTQVITDVFTAYIQNRGFPNPL